MIMPFLKTFSGSRKGSGCQFRNFFFIRGPYMCYRWIESVDIFTAHSVRTKKNNSVIQTGWNVTLFGRPVAVPPSDRKTVECALKTCIKAKCGVCSGSALYAYNYSFTKYKKYENSHQEPQKLEMESSGPNDKDGQILCSKYV